MSVVLSSPGATHLRYAYRSPRCQVEVALAGGRATSVESTCPERLANCAGIGSTLRQLYRSFPRGTVRCLRRGSSTFTFDYCVAQRRTSGGISPTYFGDERNSSDLRVAYVSVTKCDRVEPRYRSLGRMTLQPCVDFAKHPRVPGEFTP